MSMHLIGSWVNTKKKKTKRKFRNADQARQSLELKDSWQKLLKKYDVKPLKEKSKTPSTYSLNIPEGRSTSHLRSLDTGGNALKKAPNVYTGNNVKGIATMHKSNAIPVFSEEAAFEISKMK